MANYLRNKDLAKIHIAKKQLGMDDDTYQSMLWTVARVKSSKDLDMHGRIKVIQHLYSLGFKAKASRKFGNRPNTFNREPYLSKIEALLADMQLSWKYAESIAFNITGGKGEKPETKPGVKRLEWVKEAKHFQGIITALTREQEKQKGTENILYLVSLINKDELFIDTLIPEKYQNGKWKRSVKALAVLNNHLLGLLMQQEEK